MRARPKVARFTASPGLDVELDASHCVVLVSTRWEGRHLHEHRVTVTDVEALKRCLDLAIQFRDAREQMP